MHGKLGFIILVAILMVSGLRAQTKNVPPPTTKDSTYQSNIRKSNLYGVYIPRDTEDALEKLMELTTDQARKPMIKVSEDTIARKLHFGLGRWMEYNWNLVEGSRFSHHLRQKGLTYSDDMVRFMLIVFHRHVSGKPLDEESLAKQIVEERKRKVGEETSRLQVIKEEVIPAKKQ
jgi:hypothetical protein